MSVVKVVIDSDIILDHVLVQDGASLLRKAMRQFFCYTTVFNAIEMFSVARTDKEVRAIDDAMYAMKVLGLNAKSAKNLGKVLARSVKRPDLSSLIAGVCLESKLPLMTMNPGRYSRIKGLKVIPAARLAQSRFSRSQTREAL